MKLQEQTASQPPLRADTRRKQATSCNVVDNDNDNDHSHSQLLVNKALTCTKGQEWLGRGPSLAKDIRSMERVELNKVFRSDLLPLGKKWSCICVGKAMCCTQYECVMRNPGCCCLNHCASCCCLCVVEVQLPIGSLSSSLVSSSFLVVGCWLGCRGRGRGGPWVMLVV